jgi:hypothetical protein
VNAPAPPHPHPPPPPPSVEGSDVLISRELQDLRETRPKPPHVDVDRLLKTRPPPFIPNDIFRAPKVFSESLRFASKSLQKRIDELRTNPPARAELARSVSAFGGRPAKRLTLAESLAAPSAERERAASTDFVRRNVAAVPATLPDVAREHIRRRLEEKVRLQFFIS